MFMSSCGKESLKQASQLFLEGKEGRGCQKIGERREERGGWVGSYGQRGWSVELRVSE